MSRTEDRHCEYASVGAGHAASALAKLFECTVLMDPPRCYRIEVGMLPEALVYQREWCAAIFTDFSGALCGRAGLMLTQAVVDEILARLLGDDSEPDLSDRGRSALRELGNIALSAAAGALGGLERGTVLPSTPRLAFDNFRALLLEELGPQGDRTAAFLAETELAERDGPLRLRFIWIPRE